MLLLLIGGNLTARTCIGHKNGLDGTEIYVCVTNDRYLRTNQRRNSYRIVNYTWNETKKKMKPKFGAYSV